MPETITDSIVKTSDSASKTEYKYTHIFNNHDLRPFHKTAVELQNKQSLWPIGFFLLSLSLLITIRLSSAKKFFLIIKSFFSLAAERQLLREDYKLNKGSSVLFSIIFFINFSYFLYKINTYYGYISYSFNDIIFYLICLITLFAIYAFRIISLRLLSGLLKAEYEMSEYIFTIFITSNAWGLLLFPVNIAMEYSKIPFYYLIIAGGSILALFYMIRLIKGIMIAYVTGRFSIFHLFLYFCTLEILPLIVIIKLLMSRIF